jgi:hypothetical protein
VSFCSFAVDCKNRPSNPPPSPIGTIFALQKLNNSIHFLFTAKLQNKKQKTNETVDRVAFGSFAVFFAVLLQCLCSFMHTC